MKASIVILTLLMLCISYCAQLNYIPSYKTKIIRPNNEQARGFGVPKGYQRKIKDQSIPVSSKTSNPFIPYKIVDNSESYYTPVKSKTAGKQSISEFNTKLKTSASLPKSNVISNDSQNNSDETSIYRKLSFVFAILIFTLVIIFVKFSNISSVLQGKNSMSEYLAKKYKESSSSSGSSKDGYEEESVKLVNSDKQSWLPPAYRRGYE